MDQTCEHPGEGAVMGVPGIPDQAVDLLIVLNEDGRVLNVAGAAVQGALAEAVAHVGSVVDALLPTTLAPLYQVLRQRKLIGLPSPANASFSVRLRVHSELRGMAIRLFKAIDAKSGKLAIWVSGVWMQCDPCVDVEVAQLVSLHFRRLLDGLPAPITYVDRSLRYRFVNQAFLDWKGLGESQVIGKSVYEVLTPEFCHQSKPYWEDALMGKQVQRETKVALPDGKRRAVILHYSPLRNDATHQVDGFYTLTIDIHERRLIEQRLDQLTTMDELTGLPNKRMAGRQFNVLLTQLNVEREELQCALIHIDHFKHINDNFGRAMGDLALTAMGRRLRIALSEEYFVSRVDSDAFLVLRISARHESSQRDLGQLLCSLVLDPIRVADKTFFLTASIGTGAWVASSESFDELVARAEVAVENAKRAGRNTFKAYQPDQDFRSGFRNWAVQEFVEALRQRHIQFWFQPIVHARSGQICGAEALIRWKHPTRGWVPPAECLAACSEARMMHAITEATVRAAMELLELCRGGEERFFVAINLSSEQLLSPMTVGLLDNLVAGQLLRPDEIEIEITEGMPLLDLPRAADAIAKLHELGLRISIDDFGTGYSSFSHLRSFDFDVIKLDKSFIDNLPNGERERAIASMLVHLAKSLGIRVIAEGVETLEQKQILVDMGCDMFQGYYFAKPMPVAEFVEFHAGMARSVSAQ